jgi:hypothetical protein
VRLGLEVGGCENEVLWNDGELVQDEVVGGAEVRDLQSCGGVGEWVEGLLVWICRGALWLVGERRGETKLELDGTSVLGSTSINRQCVIDAKRALTGMEPALSNATWVG